MKEIKNYLNLKRKEQIIAISQCLGCDIRLSLKKSQAIDLLMEFMSSSPLTWLQRLPIAELSILNTLVEYGPGIKYQTSQIPYIPVIERLKIVNGYSDVYGVKYYTISKGIYNIIKDLTYEAMNAYSEKGYDILEKCLNGILSAHGIIEVNDLYAILCKIDKERSEDFIKESTLVRFHIKRKSGTYYVFHPSIMDFDKVIKYKFFTRKRIKSKEYSIDDYGNFGQYVPYIEYGIDNPAIQVMKELVLLLDYSEEDFKMIYHDLFMAANEGDFKKMTFIVSSVIDNRKNNAMSEKELFGKFIYYISSIPLWVLGSRSITESIKFRWFTLFGGLFISRYWELEDIFDDNDFEEENSELKSLLFNKNNTES